MKKLTCHCGEIEAQVNVKNLEKLLKCNCSICIRKNAKMCMVPKEALNILKGKENLTSYKFNTMIGAFFL